MKFYKEPIFWVLLILAANCINLGIMIGKNIESKKCLSVLESFEKKLKEME